MEKIIIEIRASEGGQDSKLLVVDLMNIYIKSAKINTFDCKIIENREGQITILLSGKGVKEYFKNESGSHRFLRVPPTEKKGRTQTSIITVAIIDPSNIFKYTLDRSQVEKHYICSSGKGGQNVNRRSTCVQLTHIPSGVQVKCQDTREQFKNEEIAWNRLEEKLKNIEVEKFNNSISSSRFDQVGNSGRSEKRRTYRIKEDIVIDHVTDKKASFKDISRGRIELLQE